MYVELTPKEKEISIKAKDYIKKHKKELISTFANPAIYKKDTKYNSTSIFTAGWPGVGKTEYATLIIR